MTRSDPTPPLGPCITPPDRDTPIRGRIDLDSAPSGLSIATLQTSPCPRRVVLALMGFRAWLDPFEIQRFTLLADRLKAKVVVVETPGCSRNPTRVTPTQRKALLGGRFGPTARDMLAAVWPRVSVKRDQPFHVVGYSLGASAAAAMTAGGSFPVPVRSLTLVEPVAIKRWTAIRLMSTTRREDSRTSTYLERNQRWEGAVKPSADIRNGPRPNVHPPSMLLLGNALRRGAIPADLPHSPTHEVPLLIAHGTDSLLCPPDDCDRFIEDLRARGRRVFDLPVPGGHPLWHSLDDVADLTDRIHRVWTEIE